MVVGESGEHTIGRHVRTAHATIRGEHQLTQYVAQLDIEECVKILAVSPVGLPLLAARRDECRVGPDDKRSFEEVIRTWTELVLSGVEGGYHPRSSRKAIVRSNLQMFPTKMLLATDGSEEAIRAARMATEFSG